MSANESRRNPDPKHGAAFDSAHHPARDPAHDVGRDAAHDRAADAARRFIEEETQFHLGSLPTEQSHPKTREFSQTIQRDTGAGAAMLLSVDRDIPPKARDLFASDGYRALVEAIVRATREGRRVGFSGCGATGRLAIILERMWREYWEGEAARAATAAGLEGARPAHQGAPRGARAAECLRRAELGFSIMTGGDRALIRSVENFEDFQEFGRRQVRELGLAAGDVLVAITEGGETSSVIGTAWEALERGCSVFFVYNNPSDVLAKHVERSRRVIEEPRIVKLDLATGPMALSGSTRLQATSSEMLVVGAALEEAVARLDGDVAPFDYAREFDRLVDALSSGAALGGIAAAIDLESELYRAGGLVTYVTEELLLDIISDTTERTPTFMIPPFRPAGDTSSSPSWAFVKDPARPTRDAWDRMLRRPPRGLNWTREDYVAMKGTERMIEHPPVLDREEIYRYAIGSEPDPSRSAAPESALVAAAAGLEPGAAPGGALGDYLKREGARFTRRVLLSIAARETARPAGAALGAGAPRDAELELIEIPLDLPTTPMKLFTHLAVKLIFNTVSTGTMGKLGRILGNWMIQVDATNKKLVDRATRIIAELGGLTYEQACIELHRTLLEREHGEKRYDESSVVQTLRRLGRLPPAEA